MLLDSALSFMESLRLDQAVHSILRLGQHLVDPVPNQPQIVVLYLNPQQNKQQLPDLVDGVDVIIDHLHIKLDLHVVLWEVAVGVLNAAAWPALRPIVMWRGLGSKSSHKSSQFGSVRIIGPQLNLYCTGII